MNVAIALLLISKQIAVDGQKSPSICNAVSYSRIVFRIEVNGALVFSANNAFSGTKQYAWSANDYLFL